MQWTKVEYTRKEINLAGENLKKGRGAREYLINSVKILNNWRAAHAYPLHIFQMTLKKKAEKVDKEALVSQRLKRVPSILAKLKRSYHGRKPSMKLSQMQDIGGCRAVLPTVAKVNDLYETHYLKGDLKHELVNRKNYIQNPKPDGYRSLHLIYSYKSDKNRKEFNGLLTEVQIRSRLQHLWATAVETAGFLTRRSIKSNEGGPQWFTFFKLVSSAFAIMESCPIVEGTPSDRRILSSEIKRIEQDLNFIEKMESWSNAIAYIDKEIIGKKMKKSKFFLLELDIPGKKTTVKQYTSKEEEKAINDYSELEERYADNENYDIVLVGAEGLNDLKKAYPSYFLDTAEFLKYLRRIMYFHRWR